jgi:predicted PurR-regulated permease PerM
MDWLIDPINEFMTAVGDGMLDISNKINEILDSIQNMLNMLQGYIYGSSAALVILILLCILILVRLGTVLNNQKELKELIKGGLGNGYNDSSGNESDNSSS